MLTEIESYNPDLILFAGDFTGPPDAVNNMNDHRLKIADILTKEN